MCEAPLVIDLFCGLGGWAEGFLAEGYRVIGFDNAHTAPYAAGLRYTGQLVLQDVLTLHGSQFRDAAVIVASPPCQNYSYLAMPWSRSKSEHSQKAKALRRKWETEGPDNRLFDACFRIQREASEAAGHHIPLVIENVRGAQPWVGRAAWNYGSYYLWGDVPALMPFGNKRKGTKPIEGRGWTQGCAITLGLENYNGQKANPDGTNHPQGSWFSIADSSQGDRGTKTPGRSLSKGAANKFGTHNMGSGEQIMRELGTKIGGYWFSDSNSTCRKHGSRSNARKLASAMIAKIPFELANHIARVYLPRKGKSVESE